MADTIVKDLTLINKYGMHVRPAGLFANHVSQFASDITVEKDGIQVPGKSIMALMGLEVACGNTIRVSATGEDAQAAIDDLTDLIARKFDLPDE